MAVAPLTDAEITRLRGLLTDVGQVYANLTDLASTSTYAPIKAKIAVPKTSIGQLPVVGVSPANTTMVLVKMADNTTKQISITNLKASV